LNKFGFFISSFVLFSSTVEAGFIEAYLSDFSGTAGESIDVYVSTDAESYDIEISSIHNTDVSFPIATVPGQVQDVPEDRPWEVGADWENPFTVHLPVNLPSGAYQLRLTTADSYTRLRFTVKQARPGSTSGILVLDSATTAMAYNGWGGKCAYPSCSEDGKAGVLSLKRPGNHWMIDREKMFSGWLEHMGILAEFASIMDLEYNAELLDPYSTLVLVGHSEYWSLNMRNRLDEFVARGGNVLILSGNTMWWQVRIENDQMIIHKSKANDPMSGSDDGVVTVRWFDDPVFNPENSSIGVSFRSAGFVNSGASPGYNREDGYGGYWINNPGHRFLIGTGLRKNDVLGFEAGIVGHEVDGATFDWVDGTAIANGEDGSPEDFDILGYSHAVFGGTVGYATMGVFSNNGTVFNAATVQWSDGLWDYRLNYVPDPLVSKITLNILGEFEPESAASCAFIPDGALDSDGDGVPDACDNCVAEVNPGQEDRNGNGSGDACDAQYVSIDVEPGIDPNVIDPDQVAPVPVVVFSNDAAPGGVVEFDASRIDISTVTFGEIHAPAETATVLDANGDGRPDVRMSFSAAASGIVCDDTYVRLHGETVDGKLFSGSDLIQTPECDNSSCH